MKIGFTGTRGGMRHIQRVGLRKLLDTLIIEEGHHGDCKGADAEFARMLWALPMIPHIVSHPPDNSVMRAYTDFTDLRPVKPYLDRNRDIVDESDVLIAAPQGPEERRSGTWSTVRYARRVGKPVYIVWPDGVVTKPTSPPLASPAASK